MTVYGDISPRVGIYAQEQFLAHVAPIIVLGKFGLVRPVPKNRGLQSKFRRAVPWAVSTVALTEGTRPSVATFSYEDVPVTLAQYGKWVELTDVIQDTHEDPVLNDQVQLAGENAAEVIEIVTYNVLKAGTSVRYAGGAARANVNSKLTNALQDEAVRALRNNRARQITTMLSPSTNIGTVPISGGYIAFMHTDGEKDIRDLTNFVPKEKYGTRNELCPEELGSCGPVRYIISPLFTPFADAGALIAATGLKSTTGSNIDVYPVIFIGKEAYGTTPLKGMQSHQIMVLNPGVPRKGDELAQTGSVGWKAWFAAVRLNETWMRRIEVGVTAL